MLVLKSLVIYVVESVCGVEGIPLIVLRLLSVWLPVIGGKLMTGLKIVAVLERMVVVTVIHKVRGALHILVISLSGMV